MVRLFLFLLFISLAPLVGARAESSFFGIPLPGFGPEPGKPVRTEEPEPATKLATATPAPTRSAAPVVKQLLGLHQTERPGGLGGTPFEDVKTDGWLVGLKFSHATFAGHLVIKRVQPIYLTAQGKVAGERAGQIPDPQAMVEARDGYAIAGLRVKSSDRVDGMAVIFQRMTADGKLNPADSYESPWIGGGNGRVEKQIGGNGHPIVGVFGRCGLELDSFGLVELAPVESAPHASLPRR